MRRTVQSTAKTAIVAVLAWSAAVPSLAAPPAGARPAQPQSESSIMTQQGSGAPAGRPRPPTAATLEFQDVTRQVAQDIDIRYSNDADKDFATLLTACRKGMAGLARIEAQQGKDPDMRRLAERISAGADQHPGGTGGQVGDAGSPSETTMAYRRMTRTVQIDAQIRYSNDADKDFAALLAVCRKFALGLAGIELKDGKDPETRRVAEKLVSDDQNDADGLKAWRAKHP